MLWQGISIETTVCGLNPAREQIIMKTDKWILPAPRASGLRWKRQCGIPFSYKERKKTKKSGAGKARPGSAPTDWDKAAAACVHC